MSNLAAAATIVMSLALLISHASAVQYGRPLSGSQIAERLFDQDLSGVYASGRTWAERLRRDGTSDYLEGDARAIGEITMRDDRICFRYADAAFEGGCFEVWQRGENCFDFYATTAGVPYAQKRVGASWDARAWTTDTASTCEGAPIS